MLKTLARTTPLVKGVLLTKVIAVCVLVDLRVSTLKKVIRNTYFFFSLNHHSIGKGHFWGMGYCCAKKMDCD